LSVVEYLIAYNQKNLNDAVTYHLTYIHKNSSIQFCVLLQP